MKTLPVILLLAAFTSPAFAGEPPLLCTAKRASIENRIAEAQQKGRTQELDGLHKALAANQAKCSDDALIKQRDARIRKAQGKVDKRERKLAEATRDGSVRKMSAAKGDLDRARAELEAAQRPLGK